MSSAIAKKLEKTMGEEGDANCEQCANGCSCTSGKSPACMQRQLCITLHHFADFTDVCMHVGPAECHCGSACKCKSCGGAQTQAQKPKAFAAEAKGGQQMK